MTLLNPRPHMLFPHPRTHMGGGVATPHHAISPLIEIELRDKDQTNPWDVLSPLVPKLTSLGHILTPPGAAKPAVSLEVVFFNLQLSDRN